MRITLAELAKKGNIEKQLKELGYDGFYCEVIDCACRIGDIAPCEIDLCDADECVAGHLRWEIVGDK